MVRDMETQLPEARQGSLALRRAVEAVWITGECGVNSAPLPFSPHLAE